jgi:hypothetical protein
MTHAFRILSLKDVEVRELAWSTLRRTVSKRIFRNAELQDLTVYLSVELEGEFPCFSNDLGSLWPRARNAAHDEANHVWVEVNG